MKFREGWIGEYRHEGMNHANWARYSIQDDSANTPYKRFESLVILTIRLKSYRVGYQLTNEGTGEIFMSSKNINECFDHAENLIVMYKLEQGISNV